MSGYFQLFGLWLPWYGPLLVLATFAGIETAARLAKRAGRDPEHVWRAMLWIVPLAVVGARLWFVLFPPESVTALGRTAGWMLTHLFDLNQGAIAVWSGGLGILGAIPGGLLGLALYARRNRQPLLPWLDIAAVGLALGQTIGRLGNAANQDLYGPPTGLPWGLPITEAVQRVGSYTDLARYPLDSTFFHPVWFYEMLLTSLIFVALLIMLSRGRARPGTVALVYLAAYSGGRFLLEYMKVNVSRVGNINVSQMALAGLFVLAVALLRRMSRKTSQSNNPVTNA